MKQPLYTYAMRMAKLKTPPPHDVWEVCGMTVFGELWVEKTGLTQQEAAELANDLNDTYIKKLKDED